METPQQSSEFEAKALESLPEKPLRDQDADAIKGGAIKRVFGGDDDLEDLEVER